MGNSTMMLWFAFFGFASEGTVRSDEREVGLEYCIVLFACRSRGGTSQRGTFTVSVITSFVVLSCRVVTVLLCIVLL